MSKKTIKAVFYGEPGTGKSTLLSKAPNPFFITTDGNFEWLDLPEENHVQVYSFEEARKVFANIPSWAETIVVDLAEDLFKWTEQEFCKKNGLMHIGDLGFGKGYDITRNDFYTECCKLLGHPANVIFIEHGIAIVVKDRRGIESTKYVPSNRIPDKVHDMMEGRVRYFLRCYVKAEEGENGKLIKKRYLSLVPKENEFGIARGIDESLVPEDIPLDWDTFVETVGCPEQKKEFETPVSNEEKEEALNVLKEKLNGKPTITKATTTPKVTPKITPAPTPKVTPATAKATTTNTITQKEIPAVNEPKLEVPKGPVKVTSKVIEPSVEEIKAVVDPIVEEVKVEVNKVKTPKVEEKPVETPKVEEAPKVETPKATTSDTPWMINGEFHELSKEEMSSLAPADRIKYIQAKLKSNKK